MRTPLNDSFVSDLKVKLLALKEPDITIHDAQVDIVDDLDGEPMWQVTLLLDPPANGSWAVDQTRALKTAARRLTDEESVRQHVALDTIPSVVITAFDPPLDDVAPADLPDPEERDDASDDDTPADA